MTSTIFCHMLITSWSHPNKAENKNTRLVWMCPAHLGTSRAQLATRAAWRCSSLFVQALRHPATLLRGLRGPLPEVHLFNGVPTESIPTTETGEDQPQRLLLTRIRHAISKRDAVDIRIVSSKAIVTISKPCLFFQALHYTIMINAASADAYLPSKTSQHGVLKKYTKCSTLMFATLVANAPHTPLPLTQPMQRCAGRRMLKALECQHRSLK